tara:strand:- start:232 stop:927 length:696 start_codon:yes stop_codon:yes gene_type:complete
MLKKTLSKKVSEINQISRKQAELLIKNKKVFVNGVIENRPFLKIIESDIIETQKEIKKTIDILLFNKPKGCITSKKDEKNRPIVYDFFPKKFHNFHYIGRLDFNSEGLLIFTNHTPFKRFMESPKSKIKRVYLVNVVGSFNEIKLKSLNQKIYSSISYKKPKVKLIFSNKNKHTLRFELIEGKNREIRNICEIFNLKVEKLKRISFGKFILKSIPLSNFKEMKMSYENYKR